MFSVKHNIIYRYTWCPILAIINTNR